MLSKAINNKPSAVRSYRKSKLQTLLISGVLFIVFTLPLNAQCAMCRAALEGEGNTAKAEAVNDGIVYLMAIPYLLVGAIFYYIYRTQIGKKKG